MRTIAPSNLRGRLTPPPAPQDVEPPAQTERVLRLATELFGVAASALVASGPEGLQILASWGSDAWDDGHAIMAAQCLLDLPFADDGVSPQGAGVLEDIGAEHGYRAAAPVVSPEGHTLGALCLVDPDRRALLSGLQRRLLAELGDLSAPALELRPTLRTETPSPSTTDPLLRAADRCPQPIAIFDTDGRCLLRNALFESLMGSDGERGSGEAALSALSDARGRENEWLADRLARTTEPVALYRFCRADGTWICIEERRTARGRSLVARIETAVAYGDDLDGVALFERCPSPMLIFDRETRRPMAVNAAWLAFCGFDRDAFLALPLDAIGPFGADAEEASLPLHLAGAEFRAHRLQKEGGREVAVRTVALTYRGRPSILVTVVARTSLPKSSVAA